MGTRGKVSETTLVAKIIKAIRIASGEDGFYFKVHGGMFQVAGIPDIVGVHKGRFIGLEVKLPGKEHTLTELQKFVIGQINRAGGYAVMVTSVEDSLSALKHVDAMRGVYKRS